MLYDLTDLCIKNELIDLKNYFIMKAAVVKSKSIDLPFLLSSLETLQFLFIRKFVLFDFKFYFTNFTCSLSFCFFKPYMITEDYT